MGGSTLAAEASRHITLGGRPRRPVCAAKRLNVSPLFCACVGGSLAKAWDTVTGASERSWTHHFQVDMQIQTLRYFLMVATTGSFLATSRHFEVPASSVSRAIASLEKELGQQLLYRSTRAVRLTEQGQRYYSQVWQAIELLDGAAEQLDDGVGDIQGLIRINAPESLGRLHIGKLINQLQVKYPELQVDLVLSNVFIDPVQEGADITIRVGRLVDSGLIGKVVCGQRFVLAASPDYLSAHGSPQTPEDLLQHSCLLYKGINEPQRWHFRRSPDEAYEPLVVAGPLRSNNSEVLINAALAGRGIVLFPTWLYAPNTFKEGRLVSLLTDWQMSGYADELYIQLLSPENRQRSQKVRAVTAFLMEAIGSPPYWDQV